MEDPSFLVFVSIIVAISVFVVTLLNTDAAIVLLILAMLLSPEIPFGQVADRAVVVRFDDVLLGVIFFTWLAKLAINKQLGVLRPSPLNVPLGLFVLSCLVSTGLGLLNDTMETPMSSLFYVLKYFEYFLLYFLVANVVRDRQQVKRFLVAMLLTAGIVGLCGYWQMAHYGLAFRVSAPFEGKPEPNTLAGYLVLTMGICAGLSIYGRWSHRILLCGLVALLFLPFLFTYSRGGYVAFIVMYLTLCVASPKYKLFLFGLLIVAMMMTPFVMPQSVVDRIVGTVDPRGHTQVFGIHLAASPAQRVEVWQWIFEKWREHPFLGHGVSALGLVDNQYCLVIGELGTFGVAVYIWVRWRLYVLVSSAIRQSRDPLLKGLALGFLAGFLGLVIHAFTGNVFIIVRIMEPFWLLAAMVITLFQLEHVTSPSSVPFSQRAPHGLAHASSRRVGGVPLIPRGSR